MLWEMLTLRSLIPPDDPARAAQLLQSGAFEPPSRHNPRVTERLDRIVMSCLRIDPEQRMPSAQQLSLELREMLHEMAAGYGRQQLARLVAWLFPEKGWQISEPDQPAAQPSSEERLSMPMNAPAAMAMQQRVSSAPPPPPVIARPAPMPSAPGSRSRRVALVVLAALLVVIGAIAAIAIVVAIYFAHRTNIAESTPVLPVPVPIPVTRAPMMPSTPPAQDLTLDITSPVPDVHVFMGARDLGGLPMMLHQRDLSGEALIAVAAHHEPRVIRTELVIELMRTHPTYVIQLDETDTPDQVAYVRYAGQGIAHLPNGDDLGPVPGVIMIPVQEDEPAQTSIVVWDESGTELPALSLAGCSPDRVCLLTAIGGPS